MMFGGFLASAGRDRVVMYRFPTVDGVFATISWSRGRRDGDRHASTVEVAQRVKKSQTIEEADATSPIPRSSSTRRRRWACVGNSDPGGRKKKKACVAAPTNQRRSRCSRRRPAAAEGRSRRPSMSRSDREHGQASQLRRSTAYAPTHHPPPHTTPPPPSRRRTASWEASTLRPRRKTAKRGQRRRSSRSGG